MQSYLESGTSEGLCLDAGVALVSSHQGICWIYLNDASYVITACLYPVYDCVFISSLCIISEAAALCFILPESAVLKESMSIVNCEKQPFTIYTLGNMLI